MIRFALLFLFLLIYPGFLQDTQAQTNDSITIIPMAEQNTSADSAIPTKKIVSSKPRTNNFWRRISVGGNVGFQFGTVTGINISPEIKLRVWDQLYVGTGFIYQYYQFRDYYYDTEKKESIDFSSNVFGGRIFLRYYLAGFFDNWVGNFFAHTEYEYLHYIIPFQYDPFGKIIDPFTGISYSAGKEIIEINSVFIGGGYRQPISNRAFFDFIVLFNLNDSYNSPYSNPIFRIGVGVGL